jgi:outer membrane protein OmpA-like peptidoglycan-associated protein
MKARGIFILFVLFSMALISLYLYLFAKPLHIKRLEEERISHIQKICKKEHPRKRAESVLVRHVSEADEKIHQFLENNPITFPSLDSSIDENNASLHKQNRIALKRVIRVLNNIDEDFILCITTHTDREGSSEKNLKLSQKFADDLKSYIEERTEIMLIAAIGYGEELPLPKTTKKITNRGVEIDLKRIKK